MPKRSDKSDGMPLTLLLSIHPQYADRILSGQKTVELRRVRPRVKAGDCVVVYATAPTMAVVGSVKVRDLVSGTPESLWRLFGEAACGVPPAAYNAYFHGSPSAFGIVVTQPQRLPQTVSLMSLKGLIPGFNPPQIFRYLSDEDSRRILAPRRAEAA